MGNNGNRPDHYMAHTRPDVLVIPFRFKGQGAFAPLDLDAGAKGTQILSITRSSAGLYVVVPTLKYSGAVESIGFGCVAGTAGHIYDLSALDLTSPTFTLRVVDAAAAAADLANNALLYVTISVRKRTRN